MRESSPALPIAVKLLRASPLLSGLGDDDLDSMASAVTWFELPGGAALFAEGDHADAAYLVSKGRLEAHSGDRLLRVIGPGEMVGEAALVDGGVRSASITAVRDTLLARLASDDLDRLALRCPTLALGIARSVASRFRPEMPHSVRLRAPHLVAVVALCDSVDAHGFAEQVVAACPASVQALTTRVDADPDLRRLEAECDLLVVSVEDPSAAEPILRQADLVLCIGRVGKRPARHALALLDEGTRPKQLVLLRSGGSAPTTAGWGPMSLDVAGSQPVVHVADGSHTDLERLGRRLTGRSVGLVLGGGGARGFAHIGVMRALTEAGIPIDRIGGSSMGSIIGAQIAMGWSADRLLDENVRGWSRRLLAELRWPALSVASGERAARLLRHFFGDRRIEDLVLDYFCTTADLSTSSLHVADRGVVADWVGASSAVPGLWPPSADSAGHLHSDGGVLDNVPTAVMRARHAGPVIASDVCSRQAPMLVNPAVGGIASLAPVRRRRGATGDKAPSLLELLNRSNLLASMQTWQHARSHADLYLTPPTENYGFASFDRVVELAELGYVSTMKALEDSDRHAFT